MHKKYSEGEWCQNEEEEEEDADEEFSNSTFGFPNMLWTRELGFFLYLVVENFPL
jgi:hypothetical protein